MKKNAVIYIFSLFLLIACFYIDKNRITKNIYISEVNTDLDYVEIYNPTDYSIVLDGYSFSDKKDMNGERIENSKIDPHSYFVIYLKKIGLSSSEAIYLFDNYGNTLDSIEIPAEKLKGSYCKDINGNWIASVVTPGKENVFISNISKPTLSYESGYYDEPFFLTLLSYEGNEIYYTLDGSKPSKNSYKYKEPILIYDKSPEDNIYLRIKNVTPDYLDNNYTDLTDKAFVIRAICVDTNGNYSNETSATYIVGLDEYKEKNIISLIADPDDLFGDNGIYVTGKEYDDWYLNGMIGDKPKQNYNKRGKEWEIPAIVNFISDSNHITDNIGIRIHGGGNRERHIKYFSLYSRNCYDGEDTFGTSLFAEYKTHSMFVGNDFSDAIFPLLINDRDIATLKNIEAVVFLNGELMYDSFASEKYDSLYFANNYGVDEENVVVVKNSKISEGKESDIDLYNELHEYIEKNDLSIDRNYKRAKEMIDVQSYIDYFCSNVYLCNMDMCEQKNYFMWRTKSIDDDKYSDGKWRFCLYDIDPVEWIKIIQSYDGPAESINSFTAVGDYINSPLNQMPLYKSLSQNKEFIEDLVVSFMDMINYNFEYKRVMDVISQYSYHTNRIEYFDCFFKNRAKYIVQYIKEEYNLSNNLYTVNVINPGGLLFNTLTLDTDFSGQYFEDYPITIKANNDSILGYKINGEVIFNKDIILSLSEDVTIEPIWSNK